MALGESKGRSAVRRHFGYISYEPWPGDLNNTRMCFELMVTLSVLLQKTLIIPTDSYSRITESMGQRGGTDEKRIPPNPDDVFDLEKLGKVVNIVKGCGWPPLSCLAKEKAHYIEIDPLQEVICYPKFPPRPSVRFEQMCAFLAHRRRAIELTDDLHNVKWLHFGKALGHFYTSFFLDKRRDRFIKKLFRDRFAFHPAIIHAVEPILKRLGKTYSAIHVRRGDFRIQYPRAVIPADTILRNISSKIPAKSLLYIATNEMDRSFFKPLARRYDIRFFSDIKDDRDYVPYVAACADMLICASAKVFIGNRLSTFSGYITRLRGYRNAADTGIYFTDEPSSTTRRHRSSSGSRYSWQESIAAGTPIWGREYREGWEF